MISFHISLEFPFLLFPSSRVVRIPAHIVEFVGILPSRLCILVIIIIEIYRYSIHTFNRKFRLHHVFVVEPLIIKHWYWVTIRRPYTHLLMKRTGHLKPCSSIPPAIVCDCTIVCACGDYTRLRAVATQKKKIPDDQTTSREGSRKMNARNLSTKYLNSSKPIRLQSLKKTKSKFYLFSSQRSKGLGEGSEKGPSFMHPQNAESDQLRSFTPEVEGFFNLFFAHLFSLFPIDSNEIKVHVDTLIDTIISSKSRFPTKYRL